MIPNTNGAGGTYTAPDTTRIIINDRGAEVGDPFTLRFPTNPFPGQELFIYNYTGATTRFNYYAANPILIIPPASNGSGYTDLILCDPRSTGGRASYIRPK